MKMFLVLALIFLVSVFIAVIFCFMWKMECKKCEKLNHALDVEKLCTERFKKRCELLEAENKAKAKNQGVANERLNMLHSGNSFDSACRVLQNN